MTPSNVGQLAAVASEKAKEEQGKGSDYLCKNGVHYEVLFLIHLNGNLITLWDQDHPRQNVYICRICGKVLGRVDYQIRPPMERGFR